jgi:hypothetical protein
MWDYTRSYFQESSIHGFWYLSKRRTRNSEKILWVSALVVSFVCCGLLTFYIGWKYQEDSLVTYTSDVAVPVIDVSLLSELRQLLNLLQSLQIPFPAVTFCPDLMSFYGSFDYNQLVTALKQQEISIDNVTNEEFA